MFTEQLVKGRTKIISHSRALKKKPKKQPWDPCVWSLWNNTTEVIIGLPKICAVAYQWWENQPGSDLPIS